MENKEYHITHVNLFRVDQPLIKPYKLSYNTFNSFEPLLVQIIDNHGNEGWGEQHISPGSSSETREGGWTFVRVFASLILKKTYLEAKFTISKLARYSKVAATSMITAIEMLENNNSLYKNQTVKLKLLTAFSSEESFQIKDELDELIEKGFTTFKIKVGKDVNADLKKIELIQFYLNKRGTLRIDANRGYSKFDGSLFSKSINPESIELFEQPCHADDWEANKAVANVSNVPIMLDEPICSLEDIKRASLIDGVELCKLKLKRFLSVKELSDAIKYAHKLNLKIVIGDGLGSEINCWMEAKVAHELLNNAGEYNGFIKIKPEAKILKNHLKFEKGFLIIEKDWYPNIDNKKLEKYTIFKETININSL